MSKCGCYAIHDRDGLYFYSRSLKALFFPCARVLQ